MKKYLFYYGTCFNQGFMGALLDQAIYLAGDKNNKVAFAFCGGVNEICDFNREGSKSVCSVCKFFTKRILRKYDIDSVSLSEYMPNGTQDPICDLLEYNNVDELLAKKYRGVHIGMSIMSSYISITRNMYPLIDSVSRKFFDVHLLQNIRFVDAFYALVDEYQPDEIWGYNGRYECDRPVYDVSRQLRLNFRLIEDVVRDGISHRIIYENHLPHDIKMRTEQRKFCWEHYKMSEEEKIALGKSFYEKRRNGVFSGDKKIYIADQNEGECPTMDPKKKNIAIMNSSEDEFTAVGNEWDKLKLFKNQYEGIIFLLENAPQNTHFYLRIHPNLKDIKYSYHTRLLSLDKKYNNVTVIPGNSTVSTYALMENSDAIVCFGSTMGIEASYWGKTSILIGPSFYYYDNVSYIPKSKDEVVNYIKEIPKPLYNDNILKYGAFVLDMSPIYSNPHSLDWVSHERRFCGVDYYYTNYFNLFVSPQLTSFVMGSLRVLLGKFRRFTYPLKEDANW